MNTIIHRCFSVKELSWCAPKNSSNRKGDGKKQPSTRESTKKDDEEQSKSTVPPPPVDKFGIVAAMSRNRVIGKNGTIPWPRCPQDRQQFHALTQNKILIVGRRTWEEEPSLKHIQHCQWCIVVSQSIQSPHELFLYDKSSELAPNTQINVASSFPNALGLAQKILNEQIILNKTADNKEENEEKEEIHCWVAGGERIYEEALKHPSAQEIHLTTMHLDVALDSSTVSKAEYAMFPLKHRWDRFFEPVSQVDGGGPTEDGANPESPYFTHVVYRRKEKVPLGCGETGTCRR